MSKGYWIIAFRSVSDSARLAAYVDVAAPVLAAAGVRFIVRGMPVKVYEAGVQERTVVIEFESVSKALEVYDSADYQKAMTALGDGAERDVRILEGFA